MNTTAQQSLRDSLGVEFMENSQSSDQEFTFCLGPKSTPASTAPTVGKYQLLKKLGNGGMGDVYLAKHLQMERHVAIKILKHRLADHPDMLTRFYREMRVVGKLSHRNIVNAFDAGESKGTHYLVMEYVPGRDLASLIRKQGTLTVGAALTIMLQVARGLEYAHRQGVIHRDVKPHNLLVDNQGNVKILDLGLARLQQEEIGRAAEVSVTGSVMGTADFMAPEQAMDSRNADARSDIYSLGCTFYYMLCGLPMYSGTTVIEKLLAHRDQPIPEFTMQVPAGLVALFTNMVAKSPEDRFESMAQVIEAIEKLLREIRTAPTVIATNPNAITLQPLKGHQKQQPSKSKRKLKADPLLQNTRATRMSSESTVLMPIKPQPKAKAVKLRPVSNHWNRGLLVGGLLLLFVLVAAIFVQFDRKKVSLEVTDARLIGATVSVDDDVKTKIESLGVLNVSVPKDQASHTIQISKAGLPTVTHAVGSEQNSAFFRVQIPATPVRISPTEFVSSPQSHTALPLNVY